MVFLAACFFIVRLCAGFIVSEAIGLAIGAAIGVAAIGLAIGVEAGCAKAPKLTAEAITAAMRVFIGMSFWVA